MLDQKSSHWRHNERGGVSYHQPHDCLFNSLFRRRSKKISKLRVTGICAGNSPVTGEFPAQRASNVENVSIWWRYHVIFFIKIPIELWKTTHDYILSGFYVLTTWTRRVHFLQAADFERQDCSFGKSVSWK